MFFLFTPTQILIVSNGDGEVLCILPIKLFKLFAEEILTKLTVPFEIAIIQLHKSSISNQLGNEYPF